MVEVVFFFLYFFSDPSIIGEVLREHSIKIKITLRVIASYPGGLPSKRKEIKIFIIGFSLGIFLMMY